MSDYLLSVILGIIEGLTEFLPVSSTAHLRIGEALLHIDLASGYWKMYTIVIQLGAILSLPVYFRERIAKVLGTFPQGERGDRTVLTHPLSLTIVAFVVTAIPAFLLTKIIGKHLESLAIMGSSLLIGGIVMWLVDARSAKSEAAGEGAAKSKIHTWRLEAMSLGQAVWPDSFGRFPGDVAVDVDDSGGTTGGNVAGLGAGVFIFSVDTDDGRRHLLRPAEVVARQERKRNWSLAHRCARMGGTSDRIRGVVYCGIRGGGVVSGVGAETRICGIRDLSNCRGWSSAGLGAGLFEVDTMLTQARREVRTAKG